MSHPQQSKRDDKVSRSRAKELTKGYATGGAPHSDVVADKALIKKMVKPGAMKVAGFAPKSRMDRAGRASGGRVKKAPQTNIHINVTPPSSVAPLAASAAPGGLPAPRPAPPPMPAPPPGMAGPGAPPLPTGLPPGGPLAMRAKGGRVAAKPGPGWTESMKNETPVQHLPGKNDQKGLNRGKPITYATGGPINSPAKGGMGPKMPGGGRGGLGRLAKAARAKAKH